MQDNVWVCSQWSQCHKTLQSHLTVNSLNLVIQLSLVWCSWNYTILSHTFLPACKTLTGCHGCLKRVIEMRGFISFLIIPPTLYCMAEQKIRLSKGNTLHIIHIPVKYHVSDCDTAKKIPNIKYIIHMVVVHFKMHLCNAFLFISKRMS